MEYDVTIDRDKYIGGSDIPVIMGLSPFKTRWQLLQEKAEIVENTFTGNLATRYGQMIEPKIRDYINRTYKRNFEPNRVIVGDFRAHTDGFDAKEEEVLEIKSTSRVHSYLIEYKIYLVQLLKYMQVNKVEYGILAVYHRPEDYSTEFDENRLQIFNVSLSEFIPLLNEINVEIDRFVADLKRLRENPNLTEQDFLPPALVTLSNRVMAIEETLSHYKAFEAECKVLKKSLLDAMTEYNIKGWEMPNGTKIARVDGTERTTTTEMVFDLEAFKEENPALYGMYLKEQTKTTPARAGYIKITQRG